MKTTSNAIRRLESLPALRVLEGLAQLHQAVLAVDEGGNIVWASDGVGLLCGRSDQPPGACESLADTGQLRSIARRMRGTGRLPGEPLELRRPDGSQVPVEVSGVRLPGDEANPLHVFIVRPVAERERVGRELVDTLRHLRTILEQSPEPVLSLDHQGFITYGNQALGRLLGQPVEELIGKPFGFFARSPSDLERVGTQLGSGAEVHGLPLELVCGDGRSPCVTLSASKLRDDDGHDVGSVVILHDVTERRRFEEALARKNAELEHYVHAVSHDLRSPLVSLLGFTRLLRQEYEERLDDTASHFLDRIEQAGHRMENLINDLLELSRIGESAVRRGPVDPTAVLRQLHAELKPRLEAQNVDLVLPESPPSVLCDRTRLYQVFANLVGNALDHMGECERARVLVEAQEQEGELHVSVRDNGQGIDPKDHERVFEIFQSLTPRSDGRRGTGIGLAIVKKIVETYGGRIWLDSEPGAGAAFHFTLPRA